MLNGVTVGLSKKCAQTGLKPTHTEGVVARRCATDSWRENLNTVYLYVACSGNMTRWGPFLKKS